MASQNQTQSAPHQPKHPWLWFGVLWLGGIATVATLAYVIKFFMSFMP